jgi:hypothetical protein
LKRIRFWLGALAAIAVLAPSLSTAACAAEAVAAGAIDGRTSIVMIRSALIALDQADKTGNYTVLRDLGGASFRKNTDARLAEVFAGLRAQSVDLSPVLAIDPIVTMPPRIEASGLLRVRGVVPGRPPLAFEIAWQKEDGAWKLYGIVVTQSEAVRTP